MYSFLGGASVHEGSASFSTLGANLIAIFTTDVLVTYAVPTDNQGNNYATGALTGVTDGIAYDKCFILYNPNTSATHQFTITGGGFNTASMNVYAFSGAASSFLDDEDYDSTSNPFPSTSKTAPTSTPTQDNDLIINCTSFRFTTAAPTSIDDGFSVDLEYAASNHCIATASIIQTTAGNTAPDWTYQINDTGYGCNTAIALKAAGGATTTAIHQLVNAGIINRGLVNNGLVN